MLGDSPVLMVDVLINLESLWVIDGHFHTQTAEFIIHLVRDPVFIENVFHHFTSIDVDLNKELESYLQFYMHGAKMLIQII